MKQGERKAVGGTAAWVVASAGGKGSGNFLTSGGQRALSALL